MLTGARVHKHMPGLSRGGSSARGVCSSAKSVPHDEDFQQGRGYLILGLRKSWAIFSDSDGVSHHLSAVFIRGLRPCRTCTDKIGGSDIMISRQAATLENVVSI